MKCPEHYCAECGDIMVHAASRGAHESSSAFGHHIHTSYPNTFMWCDVDGMIYKSLSGRGRLLRIVEHKFGRQQLKNSQRTLLPLLAIGVQQSVSYKHLHPQSGVFGVWSDPPYSTGVVARVLPHIDYGVQTAVELSGDQFRQFKTGEVVTS